MWLPHIELGRKFNVSPNKIFEKQLRTVYFQLEGAEGCMTMSSTTLWWCVMACVRSLFTGE